MFSRLSLSTRRSKFARTLALESLEGRDCPTAFVPTTSVLAELNGASGSPYSIQFSHAYGANKTVEISGAISGPTVANQLVEFEGAIQGVLYTDVNGAFDFTAMVPTLGTVQAAVLALPGTSGTPVNTGGAPLGPLTDVSLGNIQVLDGSGAVTVQSGTTLGVASGVASDNLVGPKPVISSLVFHRLDTSTGEFTGSVSGLYAGGLTVSFGGKPVSLQGATTTTAADGTFDMTINMPNRGKDVGNGWAQVTDSWGQVSDLKVVYCFA